ncbi:two-component regulator propeller domain-containing protein [Pedobacter sp. P351]|uniref:hybrid sensor histidine kinase/response regulator transcription factor n=1 Tax=Pedobacter superstes TaxID=3133441 RepID=UPI00309A5A15
MLKFKKAFLFSFLLSCFFCDFKLSYGQTPVLKFEHITSQDGLAQNTIHGIIKDKYGFMWFGTWDGLCRFDGYSFKTYLYDPKDKRSINNNRIHNIIKDKDQNIWIRTFNGDELCRYNYEHDNFDRIPRSKLTESFITSTNRRKHVEALRLSYKDFSWSIDLKTNSLVEANALLKSKEVYRHSVVDPWSLNDSYVTDIYKDNHNIFWVGTISNGINKANLSLKPFEHFYYNPLSSKSIIDNDVRAICEDKGGDLWIGTRDKGITVIGRKGYRKIVKSGNNTINDNQIRSIYCDSRGLVWIGTKVGLNYYDSANNAFRDFTNEILKGISVFGITEDNEHNMLFATWDGIYKYNFATNTFVHFEAINSLLDTYSRVVVQDREGQIWAGAEGTGGSRGGIVVMKPVAGNSVVVLKHFIHIPDSNSLSDNRIYSIYEDSEGIIWIGTGNGLDRYDPQTNVFTNLSARGFPKSSIAAITEDSNGILWISHKKGISQLNRKTFHVRNYTLQDGLQSNEFSDGAVYRSRVSKKLYFGGNNGFNAFDPKSIIPEKTVPNTVLTELQILNRRVGINEKVNGRIILRKPLYLTNKVELTYDDKSVAIEFAGLHYSNPNSNKYAYKLEGFDKDWVQTDANRRIATYSNLEPGNYTFKVISSNSDGVWNLKPAILNMEVHPPLWASTWAYIFYASIVVAIAYLYHYYSTRVTRLQSKLAYEELIREKENDLHQNKLEFFTNISHEIKTPLTLILAPIDRLLELFDGNHLVLTQLVTMKTNGSRLLKLVNELLDFRKLETGNIELRLQNGNLVSFLQNLISRFKPLAEIKNVRIELVLGTPICNFYYDEDKIEKVIANLLVNALKFTASGSIKVSIWIKESNVDKFAVVEIVNIGKGIRDEDMELIYEPFRQGSVSSESGTGLGLAYSKGLIELHGGTISAYSSKLTENLSETCFKVEIPMRRETIQPAELSTDDFPDIVESISESGTDGMLRVMPVSSFNNKVEKVLINDKLPLILIVEDDPYLRKYLKEHFERFYSILEAENGIQGLSVAMQELPDLILSDVMMEGMNGLEFCRKIKTDLKTAHIPIILLTAKSPIEDRIEGIETGADDYITKPFDLLFLTARIKSLLVTRNLLKEKYRKEISLLPSGDIPVSPDEKLLKRVLVCIEQQLPNPDFTVDDICKVVGLGRTQLYSKLKTMTGLSIAELIKEMRLERSKQLLKDKKFNINEVSFMIGFSDAAYFRKCFKAEFGITPSEFVKSSALDI